MGSDLRVVSSLLKTGDSGHDKKVMLKAMVNSCAHWMVAGLPIETFSIVLFSKGDVEAAKKVSYYRIFSILSVILSHIFTSCSHLFGEKMGGSHATPLFCSFFEFFARFLLVL